MLCVLVIGNFVEMDLDWLLWLIVIVKHTLKDIGLKLHCMENNTKTVLLQNFIFSYRMGFIKSYYYRDCVI